MSKLKVFSLS